MRDERAPRRAGFRWSARGARAQAAVVALVCVAAAGCAGSFGAGVREYDHGRYPEALAHLCEAEPDAAGLRGRSRARYALYRGLAHLALGDRPGTVRWLGEAQKAVQAEPSLLADDDLGRLASAWAHLDH
jgi:hypothetical protein